MAGLRRGREQPRLRRLGARRAARADRGALRRPRGPGDAAPGVGLHRLGGLRQPDRRDGARRQPEGRRDAGCASTRTTRSGPRPTTSRSSTLGSALSFGPRVQPIALAPVGGAPAPGAALGFSGFGTQQEGALPNGLLYGATLGAISDVQCRTAAIPNSTASIQCVAPGPSAPCFADSGGPLTAGGVQVGVAELRAPDGLRARAVRLRRPHRAGGPRVHRRLGHAAGGAAPVDADVALCAGHAGGRQPDHVRARDLGERGRARLHVPRTRRRAPRCRRARRRPTRRPTPRAVRRSPAS